MLPPKFVLPQEPRSPWNSAGFVRFMVQAEPVLDPGLTGCAEVEAERDGCHGAWLAATLVKSLSHRYIHGSSQAARACRCATRVVVNSLAVGDSGSRGALAQRYPTGAFLHQRSLPCGQVQAEADPSGAAAPRRRDSCEARCPGAGASRVATACARESAAARAAGGRALLRARVGL